MTEEKKEKLYRHYLLCTKCHLRFSIESKEQQNTKIELDKMKCPVCGSDIQIDPSMLSSSGGPSGEAKSIANKEASTEALRMANEQRRRDVVVGDGENIQVTSYQSGRDKGKTMNIPKKVIDSLEKKLTPKLDKLE
jgi:hypothetical protein